MNCERAGKLLPFLHDASLAPEVAREVTGHLERCGRCREEYAALERTLTLVRRSLEERTPVSPPVAYRESVMRKIHKRKQERTVVSWVMPAAAAVFLVASLTSYTLLHNIGPDRWTANPDSTATRQVEPAVQNAPMDEQAIINTMYHYANVSLYDMISHIDEAEWEADYDEVGRE